MNGSGMRPETVKLLWGTVLFVFLAAGFNPAVKAGNRHMVESNVKQLDDINEKAVSTMPGLPANGEVDLKADVRYSGGEPQIRIYEKSVRETREESFDFVPTSLRARKSRKEDARGDVNGTNATYRRNDAVH